MEGKRDIALDIVRDICSFWIVCVWHLSNYSDSWELSHNVFCLDITYASLFCFMFLSGYFIKKYKFANPQDIGKFYRKRFIRFYPLFFISSLSLLLVSSIIGKPWFCSNFQFLLCVSGLASFHMPQPPTLWFMSMLMFFYIITPFFDVNNKNWHIRIFVFYIIILLLYFIRQNQINIDIFMYVFAYILGLILPNNFISRLKSSPILGIILLISAIAIMSFNALWIDLFHSSIIRIFFLIILSTATTLAFISLAHSFSKYIGLKGLSFVQFISYSSFALYLFHRHIYQCLEIICKFFHYTPSVWILYVVFVPIAIVSAYIIQKCYDRIIQKIKINI